MCGLEVVLYDTGATIFKYNLTDELENEELELEDEGEKLLEVQEKSTKPRKVRWKSTDSIARGKLPTPKRNDLTPLAGGEINFF